MASTQAPVKTTETEWNRTTICAHMILWWIEDWQSTELAEPEEEHIRSLLNDDYIEGELNATSEDGSTQLRGYWKIERQ